MRWAAWWCSVLVVTPACGMPARLGFLPPDSTTAQRPLIWAETFDRLDPTRWREVEINRHTDYAAVTLDRRTCLKAQSHDGASILLTPLNVNPAHYPWLSWEWRVDRFVEGESLEEKRGSDASARLYVYFKTPGLPWQQRNLDYVWSASLPVGTVLTSAYASASKIMVVDSGPAAAGQWRRVERNLLEDFRLAFGQEAPEAVAIGVMTDTDTTHGDALAYFDTIRLSRQSTSHALAADGR